MRFPIEITPPSTGILLYNNRTATRAPYNLAGTPRVRVRPRSYFVHAAALVVGLSPSPSSETSVSVSNRVFHECFFVFFSFTDFSKTPPRLCRRICADARPLFAFDRRYTWAFDDRDGATPPSGFDRVRPFVSATERIFYASKL